MRSLNIILLVHILMCRATNTEASDIIHGEKAPENSMLYMVSLQNIGGHDCGGFLIMKDFVISAAHCANGKPQYVLLGSQNLQSPDARKIRIEYVCKHPDYRDVGSGSDIMLLKLSREVHLVNNVRTIPVAPPGTTLSDNQMCSVAGWGFNSPSDKSAFPRELQVANVSIINQDVCKNKWSQFLPNNAICAGGFGTNKGFCQGDSGGPLVCNGRAVGVVSFNRNYNCDYPDVPNVYTDITKYTQWINNILMGNLMCHGQD